MVDSLDSTPNLESQPLVESPAYVDLMSEEGSQEQSETGYGEWTDEPPGPAEQAPRRAARRPIDRKLASYAKKWLRDFLEYEPNELPKDQ